MASSMAASLLDSRFRGNDGTHASVVRMASPVSASLMEPRIRGDDGTHAAVGEAIR
jgi:hypothetical protein